MSLVKTLLGCLLTGFGVLFTAVLRVSKGIARWTANFTPPTDRYS